jgi:hypothetical protein
MKQDSWMPRAPVGAKKKGLKNVDTDHGAFSQGFYIFTIVCYLPTLFDYRNSVAESESIKQHENEPQNEVAKENILFC